MNCERCQKRLSRKTARLIGGEVLCGTCMFGSLSPAGKLMMRSLERAQADFAAASCDTLPKGRDAKQGSAGTEGSAVPKADAQISAQNQSEVSNVTP